MAQGLAFERGKILRKAADPVRARADEIAKVLTLEQGKVFAEAKVEVLSAADIIDWYAERGPAAPTAASSRPAPTACATW